MNSRVRTYVIATLVAAVVATLALAAYSPRLDIRFVQAVLTLGAIGLTAQVLGFAFARTVLATVSAVPLLAMAAVAPHWESAVGTVLVTLSVQLFRPFAGIKKAFNVAQLSLALTVAILVYIAAGGRPMLDGSEPQYIALIAMFLTYWLVNSMCVAGAIAVSERRSFIRVWGTNNLQALPYDLFAWALTIALAWVYARYGGVGAFVLALPLLGLRQLYTVNAALDKSNRELLELMVAAIEARDPYTSGHSRRVAHSARIIAEIVGLRQSVARRVEVAALLHDVGKIHEVFAPILQKPGRLSEEENAIMQTHPIKSEELVAKVSQLHDLLPAVRHHHENWDGTGYPDGLAGERIPLASRIIMFADTMDAMTSDRPYRKALDADAVRAELIKYRGRQFDPRICDDLLSSPRYNELFKGGSHTSLPHTQEVPKLRLAISR